MGVAAEPDDVLTSPQAAAVMLADRHPAGTKVLVIGAPWLAESVSQAGLVPVRLAADEPAAVVQGHSPDTGWREAGRGVHRAAGRRGLGGLQRRQHPADRPRAAARQRFDGRRAGRGDRAEPTGGRQARAAAARRGGPAGRSSDRWWSATGWTPTSPVRWRRDHAQPAGVHRCSTAADLLAAVPGQRPTYLAFDLRGLVEEDQAVRIPDPSRPAPAWNGGRQRPSAGAGGEQGGDGAVSDAGALRALAMLTAAAWASGLTRCARTTRPPRPPRPVRPSRPANAFRSRIDEPTG